MKIILLIVLSALFPVLCNAATPWQKWGGTYIRLQDDGNVACVKQSDNRSCNWSAGNAPPPATANALVCGADHNMTWGSTGYDTPEHWCTKAYGDLFATWRHGDYFGYNIFLAKDPAGNLMCASNNGTDCDWNASLQASAPERPVKPVSCGAIANPPANHWCRQARYTIDELDFSDPKWTNERFSYGASWAGVGFGLSGTQRGAPESMNIGAQEGRTGLAILSPERNDAWRQSVFNGTATGMYAAADVEPQDDLFMYTRSPWVAADLPAVVMHVYLPKGSTTSLRMPVTYQRDGKSINRWPGIWINPTGLSIRTVKSDFQMASLTPSSSAGNWWTLGLKVTASGDMEYYAAPDWRVSPFDSALLRAKQSLLLNDASYKIVSQSDAAVMVSSVIHGSSPIVIGDIRYAKIGALNMDEPEK